MCLVKVKQEEDVVVPYRVVRTRSPSPRRRSAQRISRTEIIRESRPSSRPPSAYIVPAPKPSLQIPAPQPVPVFVKPPPAPPSSHGGPHYVEVSPRSSTTSHDEYIVHEREVRRERRDYSPARSSAYGDHSPRGYEHYRYIDPPEERYARLDRSRSRDRRSYVEDPRSSYRETRERVLVVDDDGRRRREYRR